MVNYGALNDIFQQIRSLGFEVNPIVNQDPAGFEFCVGFDVVGIKSYECWRADEQVAVNQVVDKLRAVHEALVYWSNKSK